jgi:type II secretory pathway component PulC
MKAVLEIRKLFWPINSTLFAILVYIVVSFVSADNARKSTFACPSPIKEEVEIIPHKNPLPSENHKIIIERNIFASSELNEAQGNIQQEKMDDPLSILRAQLRLLATVAGDDQVACAVIENVKSKVQDVYKAGDIIEGTKIKRIDRNKIVLFCGEQHRLLNLHIACEVLGPADKNEEPVMAKKQKTVEQDKNRTACITQAQGMVASLNKMEVDPYIVNGEEKGLCIAGLDNFSIAEYFGFKNGDIIQTLNGQMLNNKQKAFQALKKARSQSSLNFQLLRNQHKMDLSFEI